MFYYESIPNENYQIKFVSIKSKKKIKEINFENISKKSSKKNSKKSSKKKSSKQMK